MNNYFFKPELEDLSQGARLKFTRDLRYMSKEKVAKLLNLGGENPTETLGKYERNERHPLPGRVKELAEIFKVSPNAIKIYDYTSSAEVICYHMWEEELFPYSEFIIDFDALKKSNYSDDVIKGLEILEKMRTKRENGEILGQEYLEWKLHFGIENIRGN